MSKSNSRPPKQPLLTFSMAKIQSEQHVRLLKDPRSQVRPGCVLGTGSGKRQEGPSDIRRDAYHNNGSSDSPNHREFHTFCLIYHLILEQNVNNETEREAKVPYLDDFHNCPSKRFTKWQPLWF